MSFSRAIAVLLCLCFIPCAHAQKPKPIDEKEISDWYNRKYECPEDRPLYFYTFEEFDFQRTGTDQAIIVAMSCQGGTGGPDIHAVLSRNAEGDLVELNIPDPDPKTYDNLFGNRNSDLSVEDGLLVATFSDDPDRDNTPLTIKYKWNGKEFVIDAIEKTGIYPTSYDCSAKTLTEVENLICHVDTLAALDVQLNILYKSLLAKRTGIQRDALREEQRQWLATREKTCPIYKGWLSCLSDYYQERIDALNRRAETPAPARAAKPART
jgi:uncharacterized protein YecT (DUF1311 family)